VAHGVLSDTGVTNEHSAKSENKQENYQIFRVIT
jgi:hypothetical protein